LERRESARVASFRQWHAGAVTASIIGVHQLGFAYRDSTKDAVVWALIAGSPILFKFNEFGADADLLTRTLFGAVKVTAFAEFAINLYVFPLWVELVLQPFVVFFATITVVAGMDEENLPAKKTRSRVVPGRRISSR
jgi:hypothetical protein